MHPSRCALVLSALALAAAGASAPAAAAPRCAGKNVKTLEREGSARLVAIKAPRKAARQALCAPAFGRMNTPARPDGEIDLLATAGRWLVYASRRPYEEEKDCECEGNVEIEARNASRPSTLYLLDLRRGTERKLMVHTREGEGAYVDPADDVVVLEPSGRVFYGDDASLFVRQGATVTLIDSERSTGGDDDLYTEEPGEPRVSRGADGHELVSWRTRRHDRRTFDLTVRAQRMAACFPAGAREFTFADDSIGYVREVGNERTFASIACPAAAPHAVPLPEPCGDRPAGVVDWKDNAIGFACAGEKGAGTRANVFDAASGVLAISEPVTAVDAFDLTVGPGGVLAWTDAPGGKPDTALATTLKLAVPGAPARIVDQSAYDITGPRITAGRLFWRRQAKEGAKVERRSIKVP